MPKVIGQSTGNSGWSPTYSKFVMNFSYNSDNPLTYSGSSVGIQFDFNTPENEIICSAKSAIKTDAESRWELTLSDSDIRIIGEV